MLFWQSVGFVVPIIATLLLKMENKILIKPSEVPLTSYGLYAAIAIGFNVKTVCLVSASKMADPSIASSARTLEIPMVLLIEIAVFEIFPDLLTAVGTAIAVACVVLMAAYERLFHRNKVEPNNQINSM